MIQKCPYEVIFHIFSIGTLECPDALPIRLELQEDRERYRGELNQRRRHPLIAIVSRVCRLWNSLTKWADNSHFWYTKLGLDLLTFEFLDQMVQYRLALIQSAGCNLHVRWTIDFSAFSSVTNYTDGHLRLFLHGMSMVLPYQRQLCTIIAVLVDSQVIAHFAALIADMLYAPTWTLFARSEPWMDMLLFDAPPVLHYDCELANPLQWLEKVPTSNYSLARQRDIR